MSTPPLDLRVPVPLIEPPDFTYCTERLGKNLNPNDCYEAAEPFMDFIFPMAYSTDEPHLGIEVFELPWTNSHGTCHLSIETAGPSVPNPWQLVPRELKSVAALTIQKCALLSGGMGGYTTYKFKSMMDFLLNDQNDVNDHTTWPDSTAFITVTLSSLNHKFDTGNKDPSIPYVIAQKIEKVYEDLSPTTFLSLFPATVAFMNNLATAGFTMAQTDSPWWKFDSLAPTSTSKNALPSNDEMTYTCDANLGSPSSADCSHIEWSELSPDSDSLNVGPGNVMFFHQNTCSLAISASAALVLTWQQVRVALDALLNICVANPLVTSRGGKAFYGASSAVEQIGGRKEKKMKMKMKKKGKRGGVTGFDALPPHVNVTVFEQSEPWRGGVVEEAGSCTWRAVLEGEDVRRCGV